MTKGISDRKKKENVKKIYPKQKNIKDHTVKEADHDVSPLSDDAVHV